MAFDSRLPAAYQEEGPVVTVLGSDHVVTFDYAEPSPVMLFLGRWWRRTILMLKIGVVVGAILAYPVMTVMSHKIDDGLIRTAGQNWAVPEIGITINKVARELEGAGWAGDRANWHPQARLTAMPAWQIATANALAEHTRLRADLSGIEGTPDSDLTAAARLLMAMPGEDMRPRLTAAAEALNRFDSRASRGLAKIPDTADALKADARLFAGWADADRVELSEHVNRDIVEWPASKSDIEVFYGAKARAHIAEQMLRVTRRTEPKFARYPEVDAAFDRAERAWGRAAQMQPLVVSNQSGNGPFMANHLASMGFYLFDAKESSLELAAALDAMPEEEVESVASLETVVAAVQ